MLTTWDWVNPQHSDYQASVGGFINGVTSGKIWRVQRSRLQQKKGLREQAGWFVIRARHGARQAGGGELVCELEDYVQSMDIVSWAGLLLVWCMRISCRPPGCCFQLECA